VHLDLYVVVRVIDGGTPQPSQPQELMLWCAKQLTLPDTCKASGLAKDAAGAASHRQTRSS